MQVSFPASKENYSGHFVLRLSIPHRTGRLEHNKVHSKGR